MTQYKSNHWRKSVFYLLRIVLIEVVMPLVITVGHMTLDVDEISGIIIIKTRVIHGWCQEDEVVLL